MPLAVCCCGVPMNHVLDGAGSATQGALWEGEVAYATSLLVMDAVFAPTGRRNQYHEPGVSRRCDALQVNATITLVIFWA